MDSSSIWVGVGLAGQALFFGRFAVQWLSSERAGRSVIPVAFWYLSLAGSVTLLAYAIWRLDPVFILGQAGGFLVYSRNLFWVRRDQQADSKHMSALQPR